MSKSNYERCGQRVPFTVETCILARNHENPCRAEVRPVGRPIERPGAKKGSYKLDKEAADKLERLAKARDRSIHDLASRVLQDWIDDQPEPPAPSQLLIDLL